MKRLLLFRCMNMISIDKEMLFEYYFEYFKYSITKQDLSMMKSDLLSLNILMIQYSVKILFFIFKTSKIFLLPQFACLNTYIHECIHDTYT